MYWGETHSFVEICWDFSKSCFFCIAENLSESIGFFALHLSFLLLGCLKLMCVSEQLGQILSSEALPNVHNVFTQAPVV
jgi:hypothetical protein